MQLKAVAAAVQQLRDGLRQLTLQQQLVHLQQLEHLQQLAHLVLHMPLAVMLQRSCCWRMAIAAAVMRLCCCSCWRA
jgi:hypothetical protein